MLQYVFSGISVKITGMDHAEYFRNLLSDYEVTSIEDTVITIHHNEPEDIEKPCGAVLVQDGVRSWIITTDGGYGIYDVNPNTGELMSLVLADRDFTVIHTKLKDITAIGGSPNEMRCFNMVGELMKYAVLLQNGMILHASAIAHNGYGIAFSAPPGTGKSTHTRLWKTCFPDATEIINDDAPAIRFINDIAHLSGMPWSGTSGINQNKTIPLKAIVCLEQGKENQICRLVGKEAVFRLLNETTKPVFPALTPILLTCITRLLEQIPMYLLRCTISDEAVETVRKELFQTKDLQGIERVE